MVIDPDKIDKNRLFKLIDEGIIKMAKGFKKKL